MYLFYNVESTYSPLSSTHLWLRCSNFFNPCKKNSFGCAANRKTRKAKDLSAPLHILWHCQYLDHIASNGTIDEWWTGKDLKGSGRGMTETFTRRDWGEPWYFSQNSQCLSRDSSWALPEYGPSIVILHNLCRIWSIRRGGYEEFYPLGHNAVYSVESQARNQHEAGNSGSLVLKDEGDTFLRNVGWVSKGYMTHIPEDRTQPFNLY
jgi:hypothetical protein